MAALWEGVVWCEEGNSSHRWCEVEVNLCEVVEGCRFEEVSSRCEEVCNKGCEGRRSRG